MIINYNTSVHTYAGWRGVTIRAEATQVSPGYAVVAKVLTIDGETPRSTMSRTGARRQEYRGKAIAEREVGSRKRISACEVK